MDSKYFWKACSVGGEVARATSEPLDRSALLFSWTYIFTSISVIKLQHGKKYSIAYKLSDRLSKASWLVLFWTKLKALAMFSFSFNL